VGHKSKRNVQPLSVAKPPARSIFNSLRRNLARYSLLGTGALTIAAAGWFAGRQMPFWTGSKTEYALTVDFVNHDSIDSAQAMNSEIDAAAASGKPYSIIFYEAAAQGSSNYVSSTIGMNHYLGQARQWYNTQMASGEHTQSETEAAVVSSLHLNTGDSQSEAFGDVLFAHAVAKDIKVMPFEAYSASDQAEDKKFATTYENLKSEWNELYATNATLNQLMKFEIKNSILTLTNAIYRNHEISRHTAEKFDTAKRIFPMLRIERWVFGEQIRAIAFIGSAHSELRIDGTDRLSVTNEYNDIGHLVPSMINAGISTPRQLTEREAYLVAINNRWMSSILAEVSQDDSALASRMINNLMSLSLEQLRTIDDESSKIQDPYNRALYVLNSVYGEQYFGVKVQVNLR
jgi:hypothetical protein